jgi:hypothetical protein
METTNNPAEEAVTSHLLYSKVYPQESALLNSDPDKLPGKINFMYDYETFSPEDWLFHADITIDVKSLAAVVVRTSFKLLGTAEDIFSQKVQEDIVRFAYKQAQSGFKTICQQNNLNDKLELPLVDDFLSTTIENNIHTYFDYRAEDYEDNRWLIETDGMRLTIGKNTQTVIQSTVIVIDRILYSDPAMDNEHNRTVFNEYIPLPVYHTLKPKLIKINDGAIQLSWMDTVIYFKCLDCALQLVLGKHIDTLLPKLEELGLNQPTIDYFVQEGSKLINQLHTSMKNAKMSIEALEEKHDWNSIIR